MPNNDSPMAQNTTEIPLSTPSAANRTRRNHAVSNNLRLKVSFPGSPIHSGEYSSDSVKQYQPINNNKSGDSLKDIDASQAQSYYGFSSAEQARLEYSENWSNRAMFINEDLGISSNLEIMNLLSGENSRKPDRTDEYNTTANNPEAVLGQSYLPDNAIEDYDLEEISNQLASNTVPQQDGTNQTSIAQSQAYYDFNTGKSVNLEYQIGESSELTNKSLGSFSNSISSEEMGLIPGIIPTPNRNNTDVSGFFRKVPLRAIPEGPGNAPPFDELRLPQFQTYPLDGYDEKNLRSLMLRNIVRQNDIGESQAYHEIEDESLVNLSYSSAPNITTVGEPTDTNRNRIASMLVPNLNPPINFNPLSDNPNIVIPHGAGAVRVQDLSFSNNPFETSRAIKAESIALAESGNNN